MFNSRRSAARLGIFILLAGVLPVAAVQFRGDKRSDDRALFSAKEYLGYVSRLASNDMEGRGTGQEGADKAAKYIASVLKKYGVLPAGDKGSYFQEFTLKLKTRIGDQTFLAMGTNGRSNRRHLDLNDDFVPLPFSQVGRFKGEVVFAGYGIINDAVDYDDYAGLKPADKVVLVFRGAPGFAEFRIDEDKSLRAKAARAKARKAAAIIIVNSLKDLKSPEQDEGAAEAGPDGLYKFDQDYQSVFGFEREDYRIPMLHIKRAVADRMLKAAGLPSLARLERQIERDHKPASKPLKGVSVSGRVEFQPIDTPVRNVVGLIRGSGPNADEMIVCSAHYDHVGVVHKGRPDFDPEKDIFNGADDNASGTAMLLTLAKAYTRGEKPNRSILLIAFTGEELGLYGSQHFIHQPTVDLDKCIAMLNFDMVGRLKDDNLEVGGMRTGGFEDAITRLADTYGFKIKDGGGGAGPSDHTAFYAAKIPVLFFFTGLHKQYHQPQDDTARINAEGAMRIGRMAADLIDEIDAKSERPEFTEDTRGFTLEMQQDEDEGVLTDESGNLVLGVTVRSDEGRGVLVGRVARDSPARQAGVKRNDRILKLGDRSIETAEDLARAMKQFKKGDKAMLIVERKGVRVDLEVEFGKRDQAKQSPTNGPDEEESGHAAKRKKAA